LLSDGNAPFDPQREFTGKNLLYTARGIAEIAEHTGREPQDVADALTRARVMLFEARHKRPRPHLDDKVLTAWNGLMIAACARAGRVLEGGAEPLGSAQRAARFLERTMWNAEREILLRRYRLGHASIEGYAEDYAYLIFGLLELFQADGDPRWLRWARTLQRVQDELFWDGVEGGWFSTTGRDASVLVRMKEEYDGAEPSASAVGAWNLLTLAHLTGDHTYQERATQVFATFGERLRSLGRALPFMSAALSMAHARPEQIVVVGPAELAATEVLWRAANTPYRPFANMIRITPGAQQEQLSDQMPWIGSMSMLNDAPAAYVCRNFTCDAPTTSPQALESA
jgi:uncharacterized protein YyaL (SSP411 family)